MERATPRIRTCFNSSESSQTPNVSNRRLSRYPTFVVSLVDNPQKGTPICRQSRIPQGRNSGSSGLAGQCAVTASGKFYCGAKGDGERMPGIDGGHH